MTSTRRPCAGCRSSAPLSRLSPLQACSPRSPASSMPPVAAGSRSTVVHCSASVVPPPPCSAGSARPPGPPCGGPRPVWRRRARGAIVGGLVLGVAQQLVALNSHLGAGWAAALPPAVLVVVLAVRPG